MTNRRTDKWMKNAVSRVAFETEKHHLVDKTLLCRTVELFPLAPWRVLPWKTIQSPGSEAQLRSYRLDSIIFPLYSTNVLHIFHSQYPQLEHHQTVSPYIHHLKLDNSYQFQTSLDGTISPICVNLSQTWHWILLGQDPLASRCWTCRSHQLDSRIDHGAMESLFQFLHVDIDTVATFTTMIYLVPCWEHVHSKRLQTWMSSILLQFLMQEIQRQIL